MDPSSENSLRPKSTADYLADREGLEGAARTVFLDLLRNVFGFRMTASSLTERRLVLFASVVAVLGSALELRLGMNASATAPWLIIAGLGCALAIVIARAGQRRRVVNWEFEWRSYCVLVRPRILLRKPGLLDRNLRADSGATEKIAADHRRALATILQERNMSFWSPVATGWALGAIAATFWRIAAGYSIWLWLFSVCGMLLAPLVWSVFRLTVFRRLQRSARDER